MEKLLNHNLIITLGATFVTRGMAAIGNLLLLVAVARLYGDAVLGEFSLALSILFGFATLSRFGSDMSVLRYASIAWAARDVARVRGLYRQALVLMLGLSSVVSFCLFLNADLIAFSLLGKADMGPVLCVIALILPVFPLMFLQSAVLKACGLPQVSPLAEIGGGAFLATFAITVLNFLGFQLNASILVLILGVTILIVFVICSWVWSRHIRSNSQSDIDQINISYEPRFFKGLPDFAIPAMMTYFSNWGIILLLGTQAEYEEVATLAIALRVVLLVHIASTVVMAVMAPHFGPLYSTGRYSELKAMVRQSTLISISFGAPFAVSMIFAPTCWAALFNTQLTGVSEIIPVLAASQLINVALGPVGLLLYMSGREALMRRTVLFVSSIGLGGALVMIPIVGIYGAVGAIAFIICTQNITAAFLVKRHLGFFVLPIPRKWR